MFDFIAKCNNSIGKFESLVHQIQKNANDIKDRLTAMEATNLFREPEKKFDQLPSCKVSLHKFYAAKFRSIVFMFIATNCFLDLFTLKQTNQC